jgi:hypothetical protein
MASAHVADVGKTRPLARSRARVIPAPVFISWVALAFMTTSSVASLRAAPTMAVFGLASVFLYIVPAIIFLLPTSLVSAELASGWSGRVYNWVKEGISPQLGFLAVWCQFALTITYYPSLLAYVASTFAYVIDPSLAGNGHVDELRNPARDFPRAIFLAMALVLLIFILPAVAISWVVPGDAVSLTSGVMQAFDGFFSHFGVAFLTPLFGILLVAAALGGMLTWLAGPSKGLLLGIDCPPVIGSSAAIQPEARARINLRVPPGMNAKHAQSALIDHLKRAAPWNVHVEFEREADGEPFVASTSGPAFAAMGDAMRDAYGRGATTEGQGGSIPLCNVLESAFPNAEILLIGVEEPQCLIHAPNESVDPTEIENMAITTALFLQKYASMTA